MKLRVTFLPLIILAALTTAVGFKSPKRQGQLLCTFIYNSPTEGKECLSYHTDQDDCSLGNTGPVCTTTNGLGIFTAYADINSFDDCLYVLRQP
jgi:hypothetical protein